MFLLLVRGVKVSTLRNLTILLESFGLLHGLYHILTLVNMPALANLVDLLRVILLVMLGIYYNRKASAIDIFDISTIVRNLVPIVLIIVLLLFLRLGIKAKSIRSVQAEPSIFIVIWVVAELLRAILLLGIVRTNPTIEFVGIVIHRLSMIAFGTFMVFRFYRYSAGR